MQKNMSDMWISDTILIGLTVVTLTWTVIVGKSKAVWATLYVLNILVLQQQKVAQVNSFHANVMAHKNNLCF